MSFVLKITLVICSLLFTTVARAEVILDILRADGTEIAVTEDQLFALDQAILQTSTSWTDGVVRFEGPLMRDVLASFAGLVAADQGGTGYEIRATAANDYSVTIPLADFYAYDVVLAHSMDGKRMTLRDKGPLWVVYPRDDHPELADPVYGTRWIWQLVEIELPQ